ncbi:hypothetical protein HG530_003401 [Fusarium avenaceum]|nr:hypothetical protein HG530_003401 [Fusarium avenaceum]
MSAIIPPALVNGEDPKAPAKKRRTIRAAIVGAPAAPALNAVNANEAENEHGDTKNNNLGRYMELHEDRSQTPTVCRTSECNCECCYGLEDGDQPLLRLREVQSIARVVWEELDEIWRFRCPLASIFVIEDNISDTCLVEDKAEMRGLGFVLLRLEIGPVGGC